MPTNLRELVAKMTLMEKASLMSGEDFWRTRGLSRLGIPQMAFADGPHGLRKQASEGDHLGLVKGVEATCFPTSATMACSWDLALSEKLGIALGREAAHHGVNVVLGPGLNIKRNPLCGRNFEYFSEDPYLSGKLAAAYTKGIQSNGVGACLKHFAVNNQETLRMTNDSIVDERTLREIYLTGFEIAVKEAKPKVVMSSYNKVNGTYAHENHTLLRKTLVDEWGFKGMVVSDWGGSNDAVASVKAGAHVEMPSTGADSLHQIIDAVKSGQLQESILDERVVEYLSVLFETQIEEKPTAELDAHHLLAQQLAEASIVLLKNDDALPLKSNDRVAIIGDFAKVPRYQGAGSSMVNPYRLDSTLDCLHEAGFQLLGFAEGYERSGAENATKLHEAVVLAEKADVAVLFIGLSEVYEVEGQDREHLRIPGNQETLLKAVSKVAKKTVVVISSGSVIEMPWVDDCDAILHGHLLGQAGAKAMLKVLTGVTNPSGKLTETYPESYESVPNKAYYPGLELTSEYREGLYVGYRYYEKRNVPVKFPFGYGLSYTTFEYRDLQISHTGVSFSLTNSGNRPGAEISQLYIGKAQERIHRPIKELKGFAKTTVAPGETVRVSIPFDEYSFRYFDVAQQDFAVETGEYEISVGSSSLDIHLTGQWSVTGIMPSADDANRLKPYFEGRVEAIDDKTFECLYGRKRPPERWDRSMALTLNDSLAQMVYAKSLLARFAIKILLGLRNRSVKKGKPDLNLFFLSNMPFRAIAKMSNGAFSIAMTKSMLMIVNGKFFRGVGSLVKAFIRYRKRGFNHD